MSALLSLPPALPLADERLAQLVSLAIRQRGPHAIRQLTVVACEAVVTLRGSARTFYEKQLLLHAVQRVPGVNAIVDEIDVAPAPSRREELD